MPILEVLRHSERADSSDETSALTPRGIALAREVARRAPRYALVVASPAQRARQTAQIIGGRVDAIEPELLPDLSRFLKPGALRELASLEAYAALVAADANARALAERQAATWAALAVRVPDDAAVLAVSHGGLIELVCAVVLEPLGIALRGGTFSYCEGPRVRYRDGAPVSLEPLRRSSSSSAAE